jgi:hypothetical protein
VATFLEECTSRRDTNGGVGAQIFYDTFRPWAQARGHRLLTMTSFGRRLRGLGVEPRHTRAGAVYDVRLLIAPPPFAGLN